MQILSLLSVILLIVITYQDFKSRAISWWLIPVLGGLFFFNGLSYLPISELFVFFAFNASFLLFQMIILFVYFSIKNKKIDNIINKYVGVGDILFLLILCFFFEPYQFILFNVLGLLLILIVYGMIIFLRKNSSKDIPLAGGLALILNILILTKMMIIDFNFYNQLFFENILLY